MNWYKTLAFIGVGLAIAAIFLAYELWAWWATDGGKRWGNLDRRWNEGRVAFTTLILFLACAILIGVKK